MSPAVPPLAIVTAMSFRPSRVKSKQTTPSAWSGVTRPGPPERYRTFTFVLTIAAFAAAREHGGGAACSATGTARA